MRQKGSWLTVAMAGVLMCTLALAGCKSKTVAADPVGSGGLVDVSASPVPSLTPSQAPSPKPTPKPTATKKPTKKPTEKAPAAPVPTAVKEPGCAGQKGTSLSHTQIKNLLVSASKLDEYTDLNPTSLPIEMNGVKPVVTIPLKLLRAIADEESGWQSGCVANDGIGFGTMQVLESTQTFVNGKYGESYDRMVPADNINIATAYLEWLTVHFGIEFYDKDFNLSTNSKLFDVVVAAFNVGSNAVVTGTGDDEKIAIGKIGAGYVQTVKGLMSSSCPCQTWG